MFFGPMVDEDTQDWVLENYEWAIDNRLLTTQTVLRPPTAQNFPTKKGDPAEVARGLVDAIAAHLGIEAEIELCPIDNIPAEYRIDYNAMGSTAGTWQSDGNSTLITYDPALAAMPLSFLSTLVHEMMHHRLHMTALDFPGGPEAEELATDLHCITTGFGEILIAGAEQAGWQGYMRQETRAFALAVFAALTGQQPTHLSGRASKLVRKANKLLNAHQEDLAELRKRLRA